MMIKTISRRGIRLFLTLYLSEPYTSMARSLLIESIRMLDLSEQCDFQNRH